MCLPLVATRSAEPAIAHRTPDRGTGAGGSPQRKAPRAGSVDEKLFPASLPRPTKGSGVQGARRPHNAHTPRRGRPSTRAPVVATEPGSCFQFWFGRSLRAPDPGSAAGSAASPMSTERRLGSSWGPRNGPFRGALLDRTLTRLFLFGDRFWRSSKGSRTELKPVPRKPTIRD